MCVSFSRRSLPAEGFDSDNDDEFFDTMAGPVPGPANEVDVSPNPDRRDLFLARIAAQGQGPGLPPPAAVAAVTAAVRGSPLAISPATHAEQVVIAPLALPASSRHTAGSRPRLSTPSARVQHPSGNVFEAMPLPMAGDPLAILQAVTSNVRAYQWESVIESSRTTYRTGYNHFLDYVQLLGTDRFLQKIPEAFYQLPHPQPHSWFLLAMLGFLTYLRLNVEVAPGTIATYCSGVRYYLMNSNVDVSEMDHSPVMKAVRSGQLKQWRALPGNAKSERDTLPVSADMIVRIRNELCKSKTPEKQSRLDLASATAIVFAFILLARVSEYIVTKSNHFIRGKHIMFLLSSGALIDSSQAHLYSIEDVVEMHATIKDSKNDEDGMGHKFTYEKQQPGSSALLCIVSEMFRCASVLRPASDTAFFAWQGDDSERPWSLGEHHINNLLKEGARLCGFSELKKFHTHSLRIGGASALAAAGAPSWVIQLTGRWKSLVFLTYIRLASTAFQRSIQMQTDGTTFTAAHIRQWNPASSTAIAAKTVIDCDKGEILILPVPPTR